MTYSRPGVTSTTAPLTRVDFTLLALISATLLTICLFRSHGRLFWADEEFGRELLRDPALSHMLIGWREGADGGGLLYYLVCRPWLRLFHFTELSLRLFSTTGIILSLLITWVSARRYFALFPVAVSASVLYLTAPCLLWQSVNGRFYGMFLAAAAGAAAVFLRTAEKDSVALSDCALMSLAHGLLVGSHILGLVYSLWIVAATIAFDRLAARWRPRLYLCGCAAWILLPISYRAIVNSASIAKNVFWTAKPSLYSLVQAALGFDKAAIALASLSVVFIAWAKARERIRSSCARPRAQSLFAPWVFLVAAFALAIATIFIKSQFGLSIFADRYLLPATIGTFFVLAFLLTSVGEYAVAVPILQRRSTRNLATSSSVVIVLLCSGYGLWRKPFYALYPDVGTPRRLAALLPANHEVVSTIQTSFTMMRTYDPDHHFIFLLDWNYDSAPTRSGRDLSGQRMMGNWKRAGYASDSILDCTEIWTRYPDFTLLLDAGRQDWLHDRLLNNPAFRVRQVGSFDEWNPVTIWEVHRLFTPAPCS